MLFLLLGSIGALTVPGVLECAICTLTGGRVKQVRDSVSWTLQHLAILRETKTEGKALLDQGQKVQLGLGELEAGP